MEAPNKVFKKFSASTNLNLRKAKLTRFVITFVNSQLLVACYATLHPALSVHLSVGRLVFIFFVFAVFYHSYSCSNTLVSSNMAPTHPHATWVTVYLALFF